MTPPPAATSIEAAHVTADWPELAHIELPKPPVGDTWQVVAYAHTHWDREWYQPYERFRMQLVAAVDRILDTLAADPDFPVYVLDGQTSVLDDYLEIRPERRDELAALVRSGRLEVGPWYILPDEFLVSGESFVRNLQEGRRMARAIGAPDVPVGYLPDPFGHVGQLPAILAGFGIDTAIFSRGMGNEFAELGSEFEWVGSDGTTSVTAIVQSSPRTTGYCNGEQLAQWHHPGAGNDGPWQDITRLAHYLASEQSRAGVQVWAAGCDHETIGAALPAMLATLDRAMPSAQVRLGGLGDIAGAVRDGLAARRSAGLKIGRFQGELRGAWHAPILSAIFSARIHLKQDNTLLQTWLERYVEPIVAIADLAGVHHTQQSFVRHAWKLALQNQPHDSIGGCSVDLVHDEMPARTIRAIETCQGMLEELLVAAGAADEDVVWNPQPYAAGGIAVRDGVATWTGELAPLALVRFSDAGSNSGAGREAGGTRVLVEEGDLLSGIANDHVRVEVRRGPRAADGRLDLIGVAAMTDGDDLVISDALQFVDEADAGDEYDFGGLGETPVCARLVHAESRIGAGGVAELRVVHLIDIPDGLDDARTCRDPHATEAELETIVRVAGDLPWAECSMRWVNGATDHRLRVHVPLGAPADSVLVDGHFALTERPAVPGDPHGGIGQWREGEWAQQPPPADHCESLVAIAACDGSGRGLALLTRGLHEYEVTHADITRRHVPAGRLAGPQVDDAALELTILRSVGFLSRDDIPGRPGHAGPGIETPGAQVIGGHAVEFALLPFVGDPRDAGLARAARRFAAPPLVIAPVDPSLVRQTGNVARVRDILGAASTRPHDLVGARSSLNRVAGHGVRIDGDVELSALTRAEDGSGDLVLRVYNPRRESTPMRLHAGSSIAGATWVRLDEQPIAQSAEIAWGRDADAPRCAVDVPGGAIRTLRLRRS